MTLIRSRLKARSKVALWRSTVVEIAIREVRNRTLNRFHQGKWFACPPSVFTRERPPHISGRAPGHRLFQSRTVAGHHCACGRRICTTVEFGLQHLAERGVAGLGFCALEFERRGSLLKPWRSNSSQARETHIHPMQRKNSEMNHPSHNAFTTARGGEQCPAVASVI